MSGEKVSSICTEPICNFVKGEINDIVTKVPEAERKEAYNTFYINLLNRTGDGEEFSIAELCKLAKTNRKNVHLWESGYTSEIAVMYNILTGSLAVLCKSSDSCNFEEMKALQLNILEKTRKLVISGLENIDNALDNIDGELDNTIGMIDSEGNNLKEGALETEEGAPVLQNLAVIFNASYEFINNNIITESNMGLFATIINKMITIMQEIQSSIVEGIRSTSNMNVINTFFGAFDCYNNFLISAIGNKLTTIFNSVLLAGLTALAAGSTGYAVLVDTLNEQNLLQSAATFYYSSQFFEPTMKTLSVTIDLGDSIKIYLMKTFPNALKKNIETVTKNIKNEIDRLAATTEGLKITDTEQKIEAIIDFAQHIKNNEELLMTKEDKALLQQFVDDNRPGASTGVKEVGPFGNADNTRKTVPVKKGILNNNNKAAAAAAAAKKRRDAELQKRRRDAEEAKITDMNLVKGGKKHKKSHKKRHQKTHKMQLKPKAKSHKKQIKPKAKSHKKK